MDNEILIALMEFFLFFLFYFFIFYFYKLKKVLKTNSFLSFLFLDIFFLLLLVQYELYHNFICMYPLWVNSTAV